MARKYVEHNFWIFDPPPSLEKGGGGAKQIFGSEIKKNQSCSKLTEMARKFVNFFFDLGYLKNFVKNEKNQSCSKWQENWWKTIFLSF